MGVLDRLEKLYFVASHKLAIYEVIDNDADLKKRGGPNDVRPYGYAVFLALQNRSTNYNPVIAQLDKALKTSAAGTGGS